MILLLIEMQILYLLKNYIKMIQVSIDNEVAAKDISIIIPVKDNQKGIEKLLNTLEKVTKSTHYPKEVIIVDNLSKKPIYIEKKFSFNVILEACKIPGPAAARNHGAIRAKGRWLLFMDSDCIPTETTISGFLTNQNNSVAYAGNVQSFDNNYLSNYYDLRKTLVPPAIEVEGINSPKYLVTANCLIYSQVFQLSNGFDINFQQAGGEDVDLGIRLSRYGHISYQYTSLIQHQFKNNIFDFIKRFYRYGKGNKQVALKHNISFSPTLKFPKKIPLIYLILAILEYCITKIGYELNYFMGLEDSQMKS